MRPTNIELLMGHNIGISKSYYKPTENEMLDDYLKAADLLTISQEHKLKTQVKELTKKNNEKEYMINVALMEKDRDGNPQKTAQDKGGGIDKVVGSGDAPNEGHTRNQK
jgi:hypothetical protein